MRVMISQPMNGKTEDIIREERKELVDALTAEGYEVVDTIIANESPEDTDTAIYYLSKSIEYIGKVDMVVFMKGWEYARGCKVEHLVATEYNKKIVYCN